MGGRGLCAAAGLCLLLAILFLSAPVMALKLLPFKAAIVVTPTAAQSGSAVQVFRLENNTNGSVAVEVYAETWEVDETGQEKNQSARSDFSIFPAQVVLPPRESRAVRVVWRGAAPEVERPFRLVAAQLPVDLKDSGDAGAGVRFLLRFKAALYIRPPGTVKSDIRIEKAEMQADGKLKLSLHNRGNAHAILRTPAVIVRMNDGRTEELSGTALESVEGENIHAGAKRVFAVPVPWGKRGGTQAVVTGADLRYDGTF